MESRDEKVKIYKELYEGNQDEVVELRDRFHKKVAESLLLQQTLDIANNDHETAFARTEATLIPRVKELEMINRSLVKRVEKLMELLEMAETQKSLVEEKYNVKRKKTKQDPKQRVLIKMLNEFKLESEAATLMTDGRCDKAIAVSPPNA